jgi:endonuclease/exonuclease/phosphatase (EEP) superfamily protein YafD
LFRATTFAVALALSSASQASIISRYFKKIPISEALSVYGSASDRELRSDSIKVLVWNIKKTQEKPWKTEFSEYARGKDLVLLQETYDVALFTDTLQNFDGYRWNMGKSFAYVKYDYHSTGSMIGSHVDPEEVIVTHTVDHEPLTNTPKTMTTAKFAVEGLEKPLLVISMHAINFRELAPFKRNMLQARAEIEKHDGPVLFAGDFNTHLKERINYLTQMMKELKFTTVIFKNGDQRMKAPITGNFLDHGFVRGLDVKSAEVIGNSHGSDHKPLMLELSASR